MDEDQNNPAMHVADMFPANRARIGLFRQNAAGCKTAYTAYVKTCMYTISPLYQIINFNAST